MAPESTHQPAADAPNFLVIRFGSLGDLCVLAWALARLADAGGSARPRVTLATKASFAPLMENVRGVDEVEPLTGSGIPAVTRLAKRLRDREWDRVIDAHNILRGHLLLGMMRRAPDRRLAKDTAARLAFMRFGRKSADLDRTMHDRFAELTGLPPARPDQADPTTPPLASLAAQAHPADAPLVLGLAPGAQWETKRWPEENFAAVLEQWLIDHPAGRAEIFLGPREETWFDGSTLSALASSSDRTEVVAGRDITEVATRVSGCLSLVTNDSGLLHVAEAVGTPVVALFGPTVREFGYFPVLPRSVVLETYLDCRPCSRNGKRPCHRGDLACLRDITPDAVIGVLAAGEEQS